MTTKRQDSHHSIVLQEPPEIRNAWEEKLRKVLHVTVIKGRDLFQTDLFSKIDPYVQVQYGDEGSCSMTQREAGQNVTFDWPVTFPFDAVNNTGLEIMVMDNNTLRPDEMVGKCFFSAKELMEFQTEAKAFRGDVQLTRSGMFKSNKSAGLLQLEIWWDKKPETEAFPIPILRCISNHNIGGGIVREIMDGGKFETFRTFQMHLWMVQAVFQGKESGWNQNYKAAQQIYSKTPSSSMVRKMIRMQHAMLYSKDMGVGGAYKEYEVQGLQDFYNMLNKKKKPAVGSNQDTSSSNGGSATGGTGIRYTYVILPDSTMHFSRTGKATAQDFLSKHALHANAKKSVTFAGEFFFDTVVGDQPALIIDNNSGTFAPPKDKLPLLKTLLELNFGMDLPIFALDREDPDLKMYFEANNIQ